MVKFQSPQPSGRLKPTEACTDSAGKSRLVLFDPIKEPENYQKRPSATFGLVTFLGSSDCVQCVCFLFLLWVRSDAMRFPRYPCELIRTGFPKPRTILIRACP